MALITLIVIFGITSMMISFVQTSVPFVPTPKRDLQKLVEILELSDKEVIYDLGSGDGSVLLWFGKNFKTKSLIGYELILFTYLISRIRVILGNSKAKFFHKNFFNYSLTDATLIYVYLYPMLMRSVGEKINRDCKAGTKVVSRDFKFPNLQLINHYWVDKKHEYFIYQV